MKKLGFAVSALSVLAFTTVNASDRDFGQIYSECGIGGMIGFGISNDHSTAKPLAIVTNVTWDLGTTAISSNISSPATCSGGKERTAAFIYQNYPQLETDLAMGEGQHLISLLNVAGCSASAQADVVSGLRADLAASASQDSYASKTRFEKSEVLHSQLSQRMATSCSI
ncbi:DUF3015 family protein [Thiomicrospira microaerophila]|uniref:DUF3015 family protein n=1 Tax=Thiomicrospira microaerophila TaxID=406020 RepID=UPI00201031C7|nr:DUF3015 family protein [Thiomicrospira microaerophila]UQB43008.1 DUF3015 family protein [Thiomicrospira microaerophila]